MAFQHSRDVTITGSPFNYVAGDQTNINVQNVTRGMKHSSHCQSLKAQQMVTLQDGHLPRAVSATLESLDSIDLARCAAGMREDVLHQVYSWMDGDKQSFWQKMWSGKANAEEIPCIFWINGSAGTGKSVILTIIIWGNIDAECRTGKTTIAYTVAEACRANKTLAATFFCSRYSAERSNPNLIFTTIAHQLGHLFPPFKAKVTRALKSHPDIGYSSVTFQLEELIINPLRAVGDSLPSSLVILDALDECKDDRISSIILSSLIRHITGLSPLKFLITSRPEQNIISAFKSSTQLSLLARPLILHEIELDVVHHDIECYLTSSLTQIREAYSLDSSWPSASDIHALAELSHGLFIFAATSVGFIRDRNYSSPVDQLASLLINAPAVAESQSSPHRRLDELYAQVLNQAFPDISFPLVDRIKMVLGSIILLRDPLSSSALENLLKLRPTTVRQTLAHLHSIVMVPDNDSQAIRLLHPSFFDFMTDPTRCRTADFVVNTLTQHTILACACLDTMMFLRQDICEIQNPSLLNSEVGDLPLRIKKYIPAQVQYACRHWAFHLTRACLSDVLLDLLKEFCSKCLLYWVEVCSLLGELRNALLALHDVQQFLVSYSVF
jgi:hypothetical protein